jgi:hypothetical protein
MEDPELRSDEAVLAKAEKIFVKSIPFEGILTNGRIILIDREKKLLPPKKIPLSNVREIDTGEDKNRDPMLTLSVVAKTGVTRQMVLIFPRQPRGKRNRERDEWVDFIREITSPSLEPDIPQGVPVQALSPKKAVTRGASGSGVAGVPVQAAATAPKKSVISEASGSGNSSVPVQLKGIPPKKIRTTVISGSGISSVPVQPAATASKKAGTPGASGSVNASVPVQPKVTAPRHPPDLKAKDRIHPSRKILEPVIASPAPSPEPVKQGKSVPPAKRVYCPQCGTQVPPGSLFCQRCGAGIAVSP